MQPKVSTIWIEYMYFVVTVIHFFLDYLMSDRQTDSKAQAYYLDAHQTK